MNLIYPKMIYDAYLLEDEILGGIEYKYNNTKAGFFLLYVLFLKGNYEMLNIFKYTISKEDIKKTKNKSLSNFLLLKF